MGEGLEPSPDSEQKASFAEQFEKAFPSYIVFGMTADEYWNGDPWLAKSYREAFRIKQEKTNSDAWLQGLYFFNAAHVAIFNNFREKGKKAEQYPAKPIELTRKFMTPEEREKKAESERQRAIAYFTQLEKRFNGKVVANGE